MAVEGAVAARGGRHPGSGRRKASAFPKGRQVDVRALTEVRELLGSRPRERDLLIEHLHLLQDRFGHLSARHLVALAREIACRWRNHGRDLTPI
jgi:formate dehydrogenase